MPIHPEPIKPLSIPFESKITLPEAPPKIVTVKDDLLYTAPTSLDVVALAKVDVPTYTQRLIDDLKKHEDEFRRSQLESLKKPIAAP